MQNAFDSDLIKRNLDFQGKNGSERSACIVRNCELLDEVNFNGGKIRSVNETCEKNCRYSAFIHGGVYHSGMDAKELYGRYMKKNKKILTVSTVRAKRRA